MIIHAEPSFHVYLLKITIASFAAATTHAIVRRLDKVVDYDKLVDKIYKTVTGREEPAQTFIGFRKPV